MKKLKAKSQSINGAVHPYMRTDFWMKNRFWESPLYTDRAKKYFREWLDSMIEKHRNFSTLGK